MRMLLRLAFAALIVAVVVAAVMYLSLRKREAQTVHVAAATADDRTSSPRIERGAFVRSPAPDFRACLIPIAPSRR